MICGIGWLHSPPWQLFRFDNGRQTSPGLRDGLKDQGWDGVSPADTQYRTDQRDKGGCQPTCATQFSAGTYISENIYSEFTADSDGNNEVNLNLDLSSSVTVKGSASSTGDTGLGIFYEKDY